MNEKRNIVECISRRYRIQSPGGMVVEVESTKPLSKYLNDKLLEVDEEISSFFMGHKILSIRQYISAKPAEPKPPEVRPEVKPSEERIGVPSHEERIGVLLKMEGEFTREDYQNSLESKYGVKISKSVAHYDIKKMGTKIEYSGRIGKKERYRIKEEEIKEEEIKTEEKP